MSAQEMAGYVAEASVDLNLNETDDDITVIVLRIRKKQTVNLMIGPPRNAEHDEQYLQTFFNSEGYHVICGGTTAKFAAAYLGKEVITLQDSACNDVPARSRIEGVELVTEGYLTMKRLLEYCDEWLSDRMYYNRLKKQKDAAAMLGKMLFDEATEVNLFFGGASNTGNEGIGISVKKKEEQAELLVEHLQNAGKNVRIVLWEL